MGKPLNDRASGGGDRIIKTTKNLSLKNNFNRFSVKCKKGTSMTRSGIGVREEGVPQLPSGGLTNRVQLGNGEKDDMCFETKREGEWGGTPSSVINRRSFNVIVCNTCGVGDSKKAFVKWLPPTVHGQIWYQLNKN